MGAFLDFLINMALVFFDLLAMAFKVPTIPVPAQAKACDFVVTNPILMLSQTVSWEAALALPL